MTPGGLEGEDEVMMAAMNGEDHWRIHNIMQFEHTPRSGTTNTIRCKTPFPKVMEDEA